MNSEKLDNILKKEKTQSQNRVWLRISNTCNNKCIFCLDSDSLNGTFVNEEEIKNFIKNQYKKGLDNRIILSGGEASVNKKFAYYIKYAKQIGYNRVQTITNGIMFSNNEFSDNVINAGLDEITFSFHGHNSLLHDYLVMTPKAFENALKGLLYIKKNHPEVIVNIDIVVNKINIKFLPNIVKFFIKLGIYEFDILQIIPFGRAYEKDREKLFYDIEENISYLHNTWELSKIKGVYMWTNRFPVKAFNGYEELIQDPRKIRGEVEGEGSEMFEEFIKTKGQNKPSCFKDRCNYCFLNQFCNDFINEIDKKNNISNGIIGEELISEVYKKYTNKEDFIRKISGKNNIPKCLGGTGVFSCYNDLEPKYNLKDYTKKYISDLYRIKSIDCKNCIYDNECKGLHINFIKAYGFQILSPIIKK